MPRLQEETDPEGLWQSHDPDIFGLAQPRSPGKVETVRMAEVQKAQGPKDRHISPVENPMATDFRVSGVVRA